MAAIALADDAAATDDVVLYIMPQRIQKRMLQDILKGIKRINLQTCEKFGESVSHIVTQYTERDQVLRQLERDGISQNDKTRLDRVKMVSLTWLSACLKLGKVVAVEDKHIVKSGNILQPQGNQMQGRELKQSKAAWACQRVTPLHHFNHDLTEALEILQKHAELRNEGSDYNRALAFRRASCVLKSLPFRVERLSQVEGLRDIGGHALKVIQNILENGYCEEVQAVLDDWFKMMQEFTSVYGVGPATAKKWIEKGWKSITDVRNSGNVSKDERIIWGLAFHEDLMSAVSLEEAEVFATLVRTQAGRLRPGAITTLAGGFRRGKSSGHDVDILLSHPTEGQEKGLLTELLQALERKGLVLMGRLDASTYTGDVLTADSKLVPLKGHMDHFEKWLGICRFENTYSVPSDSSNRTVATDFSPTKKARRDSGIQALGAADEGNQSDKQSASGTVAGTSPGQDETDQASSVQQNLSKSDNIRQVDDGINQDPIEEHEEGKSESRLARGKSAFEPIPPMDLARCERTWKARRVDLIVTPYSQYFYALVGWTGNKHFNRDLRTYAQKELNMKLSSHGLWDLAKKKALPASSEEEVFTNLKLDYRRPEERNC